jgi:hypothetical protein
MKVKNIITRKFKIKIKNRKTRKSRGRKNRKTRGRGRKNIIGGELKSNCSAEPSKFPKCGQEGCVYLDDDNNYVTKKQWIPSLQGPSYQLSIDGQKASKQYAPNIISDSAKPCDMISMQGSENGAPCFVKRIRNTRSGKKLLYEEEKRPSWCRNYGVENQCIVDKYMYNKFKEGVSKVALPEVTYNSTRGVTLPEVDEFLDGDVDAIDASDASDDEELGMGDLYGNVPIHESFTNLNPVYLTDIKMNRVKGITMLELLEEMFNILGPDKTSSVASEWEDEKARLIKNVYDIGYTSPDFHEGNIMIDVDSEELCNFIDRSLAEGLPITPQMIKDFFGKDNILKIVDWGLLRRVKK